MNNERKPTAADREAAEKVYREIWPGAPNDEGVRADIDLFADALAAARRDERETGIAEERARWRPDDAPDREPTEFEVGLWERILAGMLEDDKGFVSSAHPAFRAWCLTVIKPYTDAIVKAAREEGRGDAEARVAALGAAAGEARSFIKGIWDDKYISAEEEPVVFGLMITTLKGLDAALLVGAALVNPPKAEEVESDE